MSDMNSKTTVIYNDSCPICSREVAAYRRRAERTGAPITFAGLEDDAVEQLGLDRDIAARRFHVAKGGRLVTGLPAFILLWRQLPGLGWLARLASLPVIRPVAAWGYDRIAAPLLYALHRRRLRKRE